MMACSRLGITAVGFGGVFLGATTEVDVSEVPSDLDGGLVTEANVEARRFTVDGGVTFDNASCLIALRCCTKAYKIAEYQQDK